MTDAEKIDYIYQWVKRQKEPKQQFSAEQELLKQQAANYQQAMASGQGLASSAQQSSGLPFEIHVADKTMNWHDAMKYAEAKGMRLPTMDELDEIYKNKDKLPAIAEIGRSSANAKWVWSSETLPDFRFSARLRSMAGGYGSWGLKDYGGISVVIVKDIA